MSWYRAIIDSLRSLLPWPIFVFIAIIGVGVSSFILSRDMTLHKGDGLEIRSIIVSESGNSAAFIDKQGGLQVAIGNASPTRLNFNSPVLDVQLHERAGQTVGLVSLLNGSVVFVPLNGDMSTSVLPAASSEELGVSTAMTISSDGMGFALRQTDRELVIGIYRQNNGPHIALSGRINRRPRSTLNFEKVIVSQRTQNERLFRQSLNETAIRNTIADLVVQLDRPSAVAPTGEQENPQRAVGSPADSASTISQEASLSRLPYIKAQSQSNLNNQGGVTVLGFPSGFVGLYETQSGTFQFGTSALTGVITSIAISKNGRFFWAGDEWGGLLKVATTPSPFTRALNHFANALGLQQSNDANQNTLANELATQSRSSQTPSAIGERRDRIAALALEVKAPTAKIMSAPNNNAALVDELTADRNVSHDLKAIERLDRAAQNNMPSEVWFKVIWIDQSAQGNQSGVTREGWVRSDQVLRKQNSTKRAPTQTSSTLYFVATSDLNLRARPDPNSDILATLPFQTEVYLVRSVRLQNQDTQIERTWYLVQTSDGRQGWVNAVLLSLTKPQVPADSSSNLNKNYAAASELTSTARPGFRCSLAETIVERTLCNDPGLANLDRVINSRYFDVRQTLTDLDKEALLNDQRRYLDQREACAQAGPNIVECVATIMRERARTLRGGDNARTRDNQNQSGLDIAEWLLNPSNSNEKGGAFKNTSPTAFSDMFNSAPRQAPLGFYIMVGAATGSDEVKELENRIETSFNCVGQRPRIFTSDAFVKTKRRGMLLIAYGPFAQREEAIRLVEQLRPCIADAFISEQPN